MKVKANLRPSQRKATILDALSSKYVVRRVAACRLLSGDNNLASLITLNEIVSKQSEEYHVKVVAAKALGALR